MYDYDSVVAALAPVFNSGWGTEENSKPLYFSQGVPFQMVSTRMILSGTGDWNQWQWRETKLNKAEKEQLGITDDRYTDPGPVITLQHFWDNDSKSCQKGSRASITVKQGSPTAPTFTFVKYTPKPGEYPDVPAGKSIILLHVVQPGHGFPNGPCDVTTRGYVTVPDNYDANLAFGATINASLAACVAAKVRFGVVWRTDAAGKTSIMLYYASSTFPLGPQPRVMSIIPGWDKYYRQPANDDFAFTASNYIFFGIWRPDTPDRGPSYITASPYNWTYDPATMMITPNDSVWSSQRWELLQFELKYIVTTDGMEAYRNTYPPRITNITMTPSPYVVLLGGETLFTLVVTPSVFQADGLSIKDVSANISAFLDTRCAVSRTCFNQGEGVRVTVGGKSPGIGSFSIVQTVNGVTSPPLATFLVTIVSYATSVVLSPRNLTMLTTSPPVLIQANIDPPSADKTLAWSSNNEGVAAVSSIGEVTAKGAGKAIITAASKNVKASATVDVQVPVVVTVTLSPSPLNIYTTSNAAQVTATVLPSTAVNKTLKWSVANLKVATVDADNGNVTPQGVGSTIITAVAENGVSGTAVVNIAPPVPTAVTIEPSTLQMSTVTLPIAVVAKVLPAPADQSLTWTSGNPAVATVDVEGIISAVGLGTVVITAKTKTNDVVGKLIVTVRLPVEAIVVTPASISVKTGQVPVKLTAAVTPSQATQSVVWTSADVAVATVDALGVVTAVGSGLTTIVATASDGSGKQGVCTVTSTSLVQNITLSPKTLTTGVGKTLAGFTATLVPKKPSKSTLAWSSSNMSVVSVNAATGEIKGEGVGVCTITAAATDDSGVSATGSVVVIANVVLATAIAISPDTLTLKVAETVTLTAVVSPALATMKTTTWTSGNKSVATVSVSGIVTGVSPGTAELTAMTDDGSGVTETVMVTVQALPDVVVQTETPAPAPSSSGVNVMMLVGIGIGVLVLFVIIGVVVYILKKKKGTPPLLDAAAGNAPT